MKKMGHEMLYMDTILVPLSVFLTIGYHVNLWHNFKNNSSRTIIGFESLKRRLWFRDMKEGDDKKGMLAVQSLRNTLMGAILSAMVSILINISLAALASNTYSANHILNSTFFGSESTQLFVLKYGSVSLLLSVGFICSSMGIGFLTDANFLINACDEFSCFEHIEMVFERGCLLAVVGNRLMCISFPLLFWMLGPVPVVLSSVGLVWGLYWLDFCTYKV